MRVGGLHHCATGMKVVVLPWYLREWEYKNSDSVCRCFLLHVLKPGAQSRSTISAPPCCLTESSFGYSVRRARSPPGYDDNRNWKYICFFCFKRNILNINFFSVSLFCFGAAELLAAPSGKSRVYHRGASVAIAGGID